MTRNLLLVPAVVFVGMVALWGCRARHSERSVDFTAARATIVEYLNALEARDRVRISQLAPADYDVAEVVNDRLRRFGGARAGAADISISTDISPEVFVVKIRTVSSDAHELVWTENLFQRDGAWRLVLGGCTGGPPAPPSSIEPLRP